MIAALRALREGGAGEAEVVRMLLAGLPDDVARPATELLELLTTPSEPLAPPPPPPWLRPALEEAADRFGLSLELLQAVAWGLSRYEPELGPCYPRAGVMGIPSSALGDPGAVCAPLPSLEAGDPLSLARIRAGVMMAAAYLARARHHIDGGILGALASFAGPAQVPEVVGSYVLALARRAQGSRAAVQEVLHGQ